MKGDIRTKMKVEIESNKAHKSRHTTSNNQFNSNRNNLNSQGNAISGLEDMWSKI